MDEPPDNGNLFDNRYRLGRRLGSGGMADVYLADDECSAARSRSRSCPTAMPRDDGFVERFRREASAAAGLNHPNIVAVYDRGEAEGSLLHRHGVPRRADAEAGDHPGAGAAARGRGDRLGHADARRARLRPPAGRDPPRRQAAQHAGGRRRPPQGHRLRHRPRRRTRGDDRGRVDRRHRPVPLARAGPRPGRRPAVRPLLDGHRAVRDADRRAAVHRRRRRSTSP